MKDARVVVISSTAHDLPDYRAQALDACHRMDMQPKMMEHLPALNVDAVDASLYRLVDEADVYVGIFAHRYGYIPEGHDISITQMEYERAVERDVPRLIFMMRDDVPVLPKDFDTGESAVKLDALKTRLKTERVVQFFKNPEDLRGLLIHALSEVKKELDSTRTDKAGRSTGAALAERIHYISEIPQPPEPYIAHPYTLLQVRSLVGRKAELEVLTDWVTGKEPYADVRILNVVAIGGMGKSALTWTWFNEIAPQEMSPLAGRMWWSFYESDATFENFIARALAYVTRRPLVEVKQLAFPEQGDRLLRILDQEPFLLGLDGLERILIAYARLDAAYLNDEILSDSFHGKHKLRKTADLRAGRFLRRLSGVRASRVIVSTRLYPADLERAGGQPSPGSYWLPLRGLIDQDALALWRVYGATGSREQMLPVFNTFDRHPLLLQLLAYEVAEFRDAPGDFDAWKIANPDFDPFEMPLVQVQSHVLAHALKGLNEAEHQTLHVISGLRMPASMETLKALLIRVDAQDDPAQKPFANFRTLDEALTTLEDRGLLGWDRRANRYDLHPIVRGVVWTGLNDEKRLAVYGSLRTHFEAMPMITDYHDVETVEDLSPAIELYNTLIGLELYDAAAEVFQNRLQRATLYRLSASELRVQLLEKLFPDGLEAPPRIRGPRAQSYVLSALALGYQFSGKPSAAVPLFRLAAHLDTHEGDHVNRITDLQNLSSTLYVAGQLRASETAAATALSLSRIQRSEIEEAGSLHAVARVLAARGEDGARTALQRALSIWKAANLPQPEGVASAYLSEVAISQGNPITASPLADRAWELAAVYRAERDFIRAARLQGTAGLAARDYTTASQRLHHALSRARAASVIHEELLTLVALAELHRQQGDSAQSRAMLEDVWDPAERGPYPMFHADALNVLALIERDAGNTEAAVEAATKAYRLAWCDGPPFAYHWGLEKAKAHLAALGAAEPEMPPFDEAQHEPMPEVEINPPDEFGGDDDDDGLFGEDDGVE